MGDIIAWLRPDHERTGHVAISELKDVSLNHAVKMSQMKYFSICGGDTLDSMMTDKILQFRESGYDMVEVMEQQGQHPGRWGSFVYSDFRNFRMYYCLLAGDDSALAMLKMLWPDDIEFKENRF